MGYKQTSRASLRQGVRITRSAWCAASSATCRWTAGSSSCRNRLRRLGRGQLGTGSESLRHRRRGRGLCQGARRSGPQARAGNLHRRLPPARAGPRRRAQRQDAAIRRAARRSKRTSPGAPRATIRRAPIPTIVPDEVGKLDPRAGHARSAGHRPPGPLPRQAAKPQGRRARLRRLAGPLLEPFLPVSAAAQRASAATRFPTCARSAWNCSSSVSARFWTPARNTA